MKKTIKIISILMIAIMLITVSTKVFALDPSLVGTVDEKAKSSGIDTSGVATIAGHIVKAIRDVAVIAAVVLITVLGFKYMVGSAEQKSEYHKSYIPLIVGICVVAAASQLATMIFTAVKL